MADIRDVSISVIKELYQSLEALSCKMFGVTQSFRPANTIQLAS